MNNFKINEKANELSDAMTKYALARRVVELELEQNKAKSGAVHKSLSYAMGKTVVVNTVYVKDIMEGIGMLERGEL